MVPPARGGQAAPYTSRVHRSVLGVLFAALAWGPAIACLSALEGGGAWVIALSAAALGLWMGTALLIASRSSDCGRRDLRNF